VGAAIAGATNGNGASGAVSFAGEAAGPLDNVLAHRLRLAEESDPCLCSADPAGFEVLECAARGAIAGGARVLL